MISFITQFNMSDARENKVSRKRKLNTPARDKKETKNPKKNRSSDQAEANDEEDFPRGGAHALTPLEIREAKNEAEKDILFGAESSSGKAKVKKLKKKRESVSDGKSSTTRETFTPVSTEINVDSLTFKKLSKGILLLGVVEEVFEFEMVVSLANNLSGCVHITDINPAFTSLLEQESEEGDENEEPKYESNKLQNHFPIGTVLRCMVVSTDSSKHGHSKIRLSINPEVVNSSLTPSSIYTNMVMSGYIKSKEDHGYSVSLGVKGVTGFLSKKNAAGMHFVGQILNCLVTSTSSDKRMAQLQVSKKQPTLTTQKEKIAFSGLLPGMLVKATVKQANDHGVVLSFFGAFDGSVDLLHLAKHGSNGNIEKMYPSKTKVMCRIMYICPATKTVGLSNLEHLVNGEPFIFSSFVVGDIVEDTNVLRLDKSRGLLLQLNEHISGYAHISRISDEKVTKIDARFKAGTNHSCRILGFNSMIGLALVTLEKSVLEQPFIRYQDIKPGIVVTGKIQSLLKSGMLVGLSDHIRGYCQYLHYADVTLKHPEKKLHEGKKVKCRVLEVDAERKRLRLTHKKTLVNSEFPIITNLSDVVLGMKTHGFITSIRDYGCIVHFYNNIHGLVPKAELGLKSSEDPGDAFYVGQVVTCVVMSCSPAKQKLSLSFNTSAVPSLNLKSLAPGTLVDVDVVGKTDSGLDVQIKPSNVPAFLPLPHLSDNLNNCSSLLEIFSPEHGENPELKSIKDVLYYGKGKDKSIMVTRKQSLIKRAVEGSFLKQFNELKVGMILPGFTRQLMPYGVFVEFSPNIYGLAPNSLLSTNYISDASQYFEVGQSMMAKITEIDSERRRLLVSLKSCDCYPDQSEEAKDKREKHRIDLLVDDIKERDEILESLRLKSKECNTFIDILPSSVVPGKVSAIKNSGTMFLLENGVEGFALPQLTKGAKLEVGEILDALVLDHDLVNKRVDLSVDSNIVRKRKEIKSKNKKKLNIGEIVSAVVQIIHKEYLVVILPNHGFRLAYVPVRETLNDVRDPNSRFKIGQTCEATVQRYVRSKLDKRDYLVLSVNINEESQENIKPGAIVHALITSIKGVQINVQFCGKKLKGRVFITEIADKVSENENPMSVYSRGEKIQVKILGFRDTAKHNFLPITHRNFTKAYAELSARPSQLREDDGNNNNNEGKFFERKLEEYKEGEKIFCFVKTVRDYDIWMVVSTSLNGRVTLVDISTDTKVLKDLTSHFKVGSGHQCTVLKVNHEQKSLELTMSDCEMKKGSIVSGKITKILPCKGLAVQLPHLKHGTVFLTDVRDDFKENPTEDFKINQLLSCCILAVKDDGPFDLSTRASKTKGITTDEKSDKDIQSFDDIEEGDIVRGYVKAVSDVGVFVSLSRSIVARVQIKNLSHYFVKNWKPLFPLGKLVKGKVLSIDPNNNNIELSLKGKDVNDTDPAPKPERRESKSTNSKRQHEEEDASDSDDEGEKVLKKLRKGDEESEDEEEGIENDVSGEESPNVSSEDNNSQDDEDVEEKPTLKIPGGFNWHSAENGDDREQGENEAVNSEDDTSEDEESTQVARKKSKRAKRSAKKAEEEFLYKTEQALLNKDKTPQTAEDFDRILISTPNDSLLWLQYMAFYLHLTEIDKARTVAERALKSISFREESEKFNVWIALLNLENSYGTQSSLVKVFQRALEQNEPKEVFKQLVNIYVGSNKFEQAEQLYQTMIKRFKTSKKMWTDYAAFLMERGSLDSARNLLQRSLKSLEKRKHVETISRFAMLEFKHGEPERGKTLLDNILTSYPKRTDIWSMYVDVLAKNEDLTAARRLLEKASTFNLPSKKMKFIFKKYLDFEKKYGDDRTVENVKKMAEDYVRNKAG
ncbi:protein RRP5 homolog isoform X2 [Dendronephthya gigantea]|uniref:protein RRP5 homolog isoform X2 n=1 Tax=Dendronephthya gigantea TaxID=151771 RepID=UPI00106B8226|nr:protein RRP5 homolog isoform X2 [Dendronephthya gigantea]